MVPERSMMQIVLTLLAIALLYVWVIVRSDTHRFVVREYQIASPRIRQPMTICVLSDLHEKDYGEGNKPLSDAILSLHPDAVLSAGDLITAHHLRSDCNDGAVRELVKRLCKEVPVYLGTGNHEMKLAYHDDRYGDALKEYEEDVRIAGAHVLHNEKPFALRDDIDLAALSLDISYFSHGEQKALVPEALSEACGTPDAERFTILIAHEPAYFPDYAAWGADLVLSGHVHGGVARLFGRGVINPALQLFPRYDGGLFVRKAPTDGPATALINGKRIVSDKNGVVRHPDGQVVYLKEGERAMVLSRGLGTHTIHVRFMNPGELAVVKLMPANEQEQG